MTSYKLIGCGGGGGSTNVTVQLTNSNNNNGGGGCCDPDSNLSYILSNVITIVNELSNIKPHGTILIYLSDSTLSITIDWETPLLA